MSRWYIGQPGARPRIMVDDPAQIDRLIEVGEVALSAVDMADYVISVDGQVLGPWVPPLDEAKAAKWVQVKTLRDSKIDGGAPTSIGIVDSDLVSRTNITGASVAAQVAMAAGAPFAIIWTDKANNVHALDAASMIGMGMEVMANVDACHDRARALRAEIEAAADQAALDAIDITTGWPS